MVVDACWTQAAKEGEILFSNLVRLLLHQLSFCPLLPSFAWPTLPSHLLPSEALHSVQHILPASCASRTDVPSGSCLDARGLLSWFHTMSIHHHVIIAKLVLPNVVYPLVLTSPLSYGTFRTRLAVVECFGITECMLAAVM